MVGGGWGDWWKEKQNNNELYITAAEKGNFDDVRKLLSPEQMLGMAAEVNYQDSEGWSALHYAASISHDEMTIFLLDSPDIEVNSRNNYQRTPFHLSCANGCVQVSRHLLAKGADPNLADDDD